MSGIRNQPKSSAIHCVAFISFAACIFILPRFKSRQLSVTEKLLVERRSRTSPSRHTKYTVAACVIVRDTSDILPEFIIRNYIAGVDHFFVYGDDSDPGELSRLKEIVSKFQRFVTYLPQGRNVPNDEEDAETYVQMRIYRHCLATFGSHTHWMAFIDSDEFFETDALESIEPETSKTGRHAFLQDILMNYDKFPVLCMRWRSFLTNGQLFPPPKGATLLDHFPVSCKPIVNNTIKLSLRKTILQPRHADLDSTAKLDVALHKGFKLLPPRRKFNCIWGLGADMQPPLYLAHYWSRSVFEYVQKMERGRPRQGVAVRTLMDLYRREAVCEPDYATKVAGMRKDFVRSFGDSLKLFEDKPLSILTIETLLKSTAASEDSSFCGPRLRTLLYRMVEGYTLSPKRYCQQVKNSPVCLKTQSEYVDRVWPFAWFEFIQSCEGPLDEDKIFVSRQR